MDSFKSAPCWMVTTEFWEDDKAGLMTESWSDNLRADLMIQDLVSTLSWFSTVADLQYNLAVDLQLFRCYPPHSVSRDMLCLIVVYPEYLNVILCLRRVSCNGKLLFSTQSCFITPRVFQMLLQFHWIVCRLSACF